MSSVNEHLQAGLAQHQRGDLAEAEASYQLVLAREPGNLQAMHLLGVVFHQRGENARAVELLERVVKSAPRAAVVRVNFATALVAAGRAEGAVEQFRQALQLEPKLVLAAQALASLLLRMGRLDAAIEAFRVAIQLDPKAAAVHNDLGSMLLTLGQTEEAERALLMAAALDPNLVEAHSNLSRLYLDAGRTTEAVAAGERAVRVKPSFAAGWNNLGNALAAQVRHREAEAAYRKAVALEPDSPLLVSNLLFHLNYCNWLSPTQIANEHLNFGRAMDGRAATQRRPHNQIRGGDRRLRIGYVSADFRAHSVAYFFEPLLTARDRERFEVYCYADVRRGDAITERLKNSADVWRTTAGMPDAQLAELIRADAIDILVDLAGHTAENRMMLFALKPAPVAATYLGYPNTTGLPSIDYRLTDEICDPIGEADDLYAEKRFRLKRCFLCYAMPGNLPEVSTLPAEASGFVTFGSFNALAKICEPTLRLWSRVLEAVPGSKLLLKSRPLADGGTRAIVAQSLNRCGIASDRVEMLGYAKDFQEHLDLYSRVDLALDPFPYNGTTTTCEAMAMGVPVIALAGNSHVSRVGASLMAAVGMGEMVANTEAEYVEIAKRMAADLEGLKVMRAGLRERMRQSELCDAVGFVKEVESLMFSLSPHARGG